MKVREIYKKFKVPPNLQEHHLRVAKVAMFICDHWQGSKVDLSLIIKEALLHDIGNIVKFNIEKYPEFLGDESKRIDYWLKVQKEMIVKYGQDDKQATAHMLNEIGVDKKIIDLILAKGFLHSVETEKSGSWELKILLYADLRVGPFGVVSLIERLEEALNRYAPAEKNKWQPQTKACFRIEKQIQANTNADLINLREDQLPKENEELLGLEI